MAYSVSLPSYLVQGEHGVIPDTDHAARLLHDVFVRGTTLGREEGKQKLSWGHGDSPVSIFVKSAFLLGGEVFL